MHDVITLSDTMSYDKLYETNLLVHCFQIYSKFFNYKMIIDYGDAFDVQVINFEFSVLLEKFKKYMLY